MTATPANGQETKRAEILEAARRLAAAEGWAAVTLRRLAASIGCSAPALYQYFAGKNELLAALAETGDRRLVEMLSAAAAISRGPVKRLRAVVEAYWRFAVDNAELYAVMHGAEVVAQTVTGLTAQEILRGAASDVIAKRRVAIAPEEVADRLTAILHGFISMALAGRFAGGQERARSLLLHSVEDLLAGLGRD